MKILVLSCGGTIVSPAKSTLKAAAKAREDAAEYLIEEISSDRFRQALQDRFDENEGVWSSDLGKVPEFIPAFATDLDSTNVGPMQWKTIIEAIVSSYDQVDGFLLPHGTNSLAYTASALSFGLRGLGKPVVITGSNVPIGTPFSDGPLNAANSVLLLQKMIAERKAGVLSVFASKVMPGVRTKKSNGIEFEAFRTFNAYDVGQCRKDEIFINEQEFAKYRPKEIKESPWNSDPIAENKAELASLVADRFDGNISSHTFHPGDDARTYGAVVDFLIEEREKRGVPGALILRAVGDGDVSDELRDRLFPIAHDAHIPIVVTTQEPGGVSGIGSNEVSGGAVKELGVIPAHDMSIETMVVKLRFLMGQGKSYEEIQQEFVKNYLGEIQIRRRGH